MAFAAEVLRTEGVADEDSYLFITQDKSAEDVLQSSGWRAFIVPKSDPSKQHEVSLSGVDFDTMSRHELRAKLGQGHDFVINYSSGSGVASVDGTRVSSIDNPAEIHRLVREKHWMSGPSFGWHEGDFAADGFSTASMLDGDSWIFLRKDYKTGQIQRFTQSGTSGLGRLEIIQGEPGNTRWGTNGEIERPAVSSSDLVRPPEDVRKLAIGETDGLTDGPVKCNRSTTFSIHRMKSYRDRKE